jgi:hypothetical protein
MKEKDLILTLGVMVWLRDRLENSNFRHDMKRSTKLYADVLNRYITQVCADPNVWDEYTELTNTISDKLDECIVEVVE